MTPRALGYAVLLYAVCTSSAGLRLVWLATGNWDGDWWALSHVGLWASFVVGGVGLISDRVWARIVLLFAAVASALMAGLGVVFFWGDGMLLVGLSSILTMLVSVAIVIGIRSLPTPAVPKAQASIDQANRAESRSPPSSTAPGKRVVSHRIDLAYGCFAFTAFVGWIEPVGKLLPIDSGTGGALLMLLSIPIVFAALFATGTAFIVSILEWREWPLLIMTGTLISMIFLFLAIDERGVGMGNGSYVDPIWYVGGTALLLALCVRWFGFARRRHLMSTQ